MSWETFVVGTLEIAQGVPEEKKAKIIDDFEGVLETDLIWDDQNKEYKISHVNWSSHVREEDIKKCYQKHKRHIKCISLSLWCLSEPDLSLHEDISEHEQVFGRWYKQRPATSYHQRICSIFVRDTAASNQGSRGGVIRMYGLQET